jgi:hypothetical protein
MLLCAPDARTVVPHSYRYIAVDRDRAHIIVALQHGMASPMPNTSFTHKILKYRRYQPKRAGILRIKMPDK